MSTLFIEIFMHSSFCLLAQIVEIMGGSLYQIFFKGSHMKIYTC